MPDHDADARRALARLQRAVEKLRRELNALREAAEKADPTGFSADEYSSAEVALDTFVELASAEGARFRDRILRGGGLDAGRLRPSDTD